MPRKQIKKEALQSAGDITHDNLVYIVAEVLQRIRGKGTVLERSQQFGYTIKPVYGSGGSWTGPIEYQTERQKLMKYHGSLVALLKKVREAYP